MSWFEKLKDLGTKFYLLTPLLYTFLNYFFVIKPEQRFSWMGWAWLIVSIAYFAIALYWIVKNW